MYTNLIFLVFMKNFKKGVLISAFLMFGAGAIPIPNLNIIPAAHAGTVTIYSTTINGVEWKVKITDGSSLKLIKDGTQKVKEDVANFVSFINQVKSKTGESYSTIYNRIKNYLS